MTATSETEAPDSFTEDELGLRRGIMLGRYTTFRIGGPAAWYAEPRDRADLRRLVEWARGCGVPVTVLGGGSNLLISDVGLPGLVLRLAKLKALVFEDRDAVADAGLPLVSLLKRTADRGLSGLEGVVGVPGAVGGAVVMNAGTPHGEFGDSIVEAEILQAGGDFQTVPRDALGLGYRSSELKDRGETLVSVRLRLTPGDPGAIRDRMESLDAHRHSSQPLTLPSAGCIWKNPQPRTAGRLVDEAGCKGMRVGAAEVSTLHANFMVNRGSATAADVVRLMTRVRQRVQETSGIRLEPEVQLMGAMDWER